MSDPGDSCCSTCRREHAEASAALIDAFHAAGAQRILAAIRELPRDDVLVAQVVELFWEYAHDGTSGLDQDAAHAVIDAVREHDRQTALMRDALDDHQAQNNEDTERPY